MKLKTGKGLGGLAAAVQRVGEKDPLFGRSGNFPRLVELDLDKVRPRPDQPRRHFDEAELRALAESIRAKGLLQPILVRRGEGEAYDIVAGERRWRAHGMLGLATIFAIVTEGDAAELALIENLQRVDLTPLEEARGLRDLIGSHGYTQEQAGAAVGWSLTRVNTSLRLLDLPAHIQEELAAPQTAVPKAVLLEIARAGDPATQERLWAQARAGAGEKALRAARPAKFTRAADADRAVGRFFQDVARVARGAEAILPSGARLDERQRDELRRLRDRIDALIG